MNSELVFGLTSLATMIASIAFVVILHRVEPEFDPSWRMLSEYSLGRFGFLMRMAFIFGAAAVISGAVLLFHSTPVGAISLMLCATGPLGAAFVDTDPITTPRNQISARSKIHCALGSVFILGFPLAATFAGTTSGSAILGWSSVLPWIGLVWFMRATLKHPAANGVGSPEQRIGWPNRINMLTYFAWLAMVVLVSMA